MYVASKFKKTLELLWHRWFQDSTISKLQYYSYLEVIAFVSLKIPRYFLKMYDKYWI